MTAIEAARFRAVENGFCGRGRAGRDRKERGGPVAASPYAFHSTYRLVARRNPWARTNVAPFTVARRYVYCGSGRWLGSFHGGVSGPSGANDPDSRGE